MRKEKEIQCQMTSHWADGQTLRRGVAVRYQRMGSQVKLMYKQKLDPDSQKEQPEILTVDIDGEHAPCRASLKRPGSRFHLQFAPAETCRSLYETPAGLLEVELVTLHMEGCLAPETLWLRLRYELWLAGERQGEMELMLERCAD